MISVVKGVGCVLSSRNITTFIYGILSLNVTLTGHFLKVCQTPIKHIFLELLPNFKRLLLGFFG